MEQARTQLGLRGWAQRPRLSELWPGRHEAPDSFVLTYAIDEREVEAFRFAPDANIFGDGSCLDGQEEEISVNERLMKGMGTPEELAKKTAAATTKA